MILYMIMVAGLHRYRKTP